MVVYLTTVNDDGAAARSERALRWDLAWPLFLPECPGDVPAGDPKAALGPLLGWAWQRLGRLAGRMRPAPADPVWFVLPALSTAARELVVRVASFWADEVYEGPSPGDDPGPNLWTPPLVRLETPPEPGGLAERASESWESGGERYFYPHLGYGRAYMRLETVAPGDASARLHSHSAVDEYYLIVEGRGTLRMGSHRVAVGPGTLVGKPVGPDLTSHVVADQGEAVRILDMEVWPAADYGAKDVVHYPDFDEVLLRGPGWSEVLSATALLSAADFRRHYDDGYRREPGGAWTPKDIPGAPARRGSD